MADMLAKINDTSIKIENQEEKLTEISSKLSTYEDHIYKAKINKMYSHCHSRSATRNVRNHRDFIKLSGYEYRLKKQSINKTRIQPMPLKITGN